jgi:hypothetical protein
LRRTAKDDVPISVCKMQICREDIDDEAKWRYAVKTSMMKLAAALGLAGALALGAATVSFAQNPHSQGSSCVQQYDGTGAQRPPYC